MNAEELNVLIKQMNIEVTREKKGALRSISKLKQKKNVEESELLADLKALNLRSKSLGKIVQTLDAKVKHYKKKLRLFIQDKKQKESLKKILLKRVKALANVAKKVVVFRIILKGLMSKRERLETQKISTQGEIKRLQQKMVNVRSSLSSINTKLNPLHIEIEKYHKQADEHNKKEILSKELVKDVDKISKQVVSIHGKEKMLVSKDNQITKLLGQLKAMHSIKKFEEREIQEALMRLNKEEGRIKKVKF